MLLCAHNGFRFDFAMLLFECRRHNLGFAALAGWLFVDTLAVVQAAKEEMGACFKLECLTRKTCRLHDLRAHRALDDCFALRGAVEYLAARFGCSLPDLLRRFAFRLDATASAEQIASM